MCIFGGICVGLAAICESLSYYRIVIKIIKEKRSTQISSSAYMLKILKYLLSLVALVIYKNWIGVILECVALIWCCITLVIIIRHKPVGWELFESKQIKEGE